MERNVSLAEDSFIHFTYEDRARQIVEEGVLLATPPFQKFGIAGVQAVSVEHGQHVPKVQTTHLQDSDKTVVAIHFKTDTMPKIGYPEEVIWPENTDVNLIGAKIISAQQAISMLGSEGEDYTLIYESLLSNLLH